jgi:hypothetical protein
MTQTGFVGRPSTLAALGALVLLLCGLMVATSPPAEAHDTCTTHPEGSVACLKDNHTRLDVCDRDSDGHRVYVRRTLNDGTVMPPYYDPDGAGGSCGHVYGNWGVSLYAYNVCVESEGCGSPVYWWQF